MINKIQKKKREPIERENDQFKEKGENKKLEGKNKRSKVMVFVRVIYFFPKKIYKFQRNSSLPLENSVFPNFFAFLFFVFFIFRSCPLSEKGFFF